MSQQFNASTVTQCGLILIPRAEAKMNLNDFRIKMKSKRGKFCRVLKKSQIELQRSDGIRGESKN
jgi:hypothetical protein